MSNSLKVGAGGFGVMIIGILIGIVFMAPKEIACYPDAHAVEINGYTYRVDILRYDSQNDRFVDFFTGEAAYE